jgi:carbamoyl-phosphate synthase large subunit
MNVLLTCAGRRNYLIEYFRHALRGRGQVLAADSNPAAPAMLEADRAFAVPPIDQAGYVEELMRICLEHRARLLVPLNDLELPLLARSRARFRAVGAIPLVASPEVVDLCFDKWATVRFLEAAGLPAPATFVGLAEARAALARGALKPPLVLKPRWGSASIGIAHVEGVEELEAAYADARRQLRRSILAGPSAADPEHAILIQERARGEEYGLDIVNDLQGRHVATFVRRKLAMRAGETDSAVTVDSPALRALGASIGERLGHVGNLDCDVFLAGDDSQVLELNPRFGGGYPFSHAAGADLPAALLAWAAGETPDPAWLQPRPGVRAAKCDRIAVAAATPARAGRVGHDDRASPERAPAPAPLA